MFAFSSNKASSLITRPLGSSIRTVIVPYAPVTRKKMYRDASAKLRRRIRKSNESYRKPTLDMAHAMPLSVQEMDNNTLVTVGATGNHAARIEILKRHIMSVDKVSYEKAVESFKKISAKNKEGMILLSLPYQIGVGVAVSAGLASIPMVFDLGTASWFNTHYVTTDVPEPADLETALEVGSWAWNWMEPPLGTISFVLLALQFSRAQLDNLGIKPYTHRVKVWRGRRLAEAFPQYDANLLIQYSNTSTIYK